MKPPIFFCNTHIDVIDNDVVWKRCPCLSAQDGRIFSHQLLLNIHTKCSSNYLTSATFFHWSTLVYSKISFTWFKINVGCFVFQSCHRQTMILSPRWNGFLLSSRAVSTTTVSSILIS